MFLPRVSFISGLYLTYWPVSIGLSCLETDYIQRALLFIACCLFIWIYRGKLTKLRWGGARNWYDLPALLHFLIMSGMQGARKSKTAKRQATVMLIMWWQGACQMFQAFPKIVLKLLQSVFYEQEKRPRAPLSSVCIVFWQKLQLQTEVPNQSVSEPSNVRNETVNPPMTNPCSW